MQAQMSLTHEEFTVATKPSYIGTLNAIANGERGGYELFWSWSDATKDKPL
jgi:hypothetical protein